MGEGGTTGYTFRKATLLIITRPSLGSRAKVCNVFVQLSALSRYDHRVYISESDTYNHYPFLFGVESQTL